MGLLTVRQSGYCRPRSFCSLEFTLGVTFFACLKSDSASREGVTFRLPRFTVTHPVGLTRLRSSGLFILSTESICATRFGRIAQRVTGN